MIPKLLIFPKNDRYGHLVVNKFFLNNYTTEDTIPLTGYNLTLIFLIMLY